MTGVARLDIRWWLYGLAAFAVVIALSAPLQIYSEYGIGDHQVARTAARVNVIQSAWHDAGLSVLAILGMIADLVFIWIYSLGAWRAGQSCRRVAQPFFSVVGLAVSIAAAVFCVTDYLETLLQLIQLVRGAGIDWMAATAAFVQPIKIWAWIFTFFGVIAAIVMKRISGVDT